MNQNHIQSTFELDSVEGQFIGWHLNQTWNGFACPKFDAKVAAAIINALAASGTSSTFIQNEDAIICGDDDTDETTVVEAELIQTSTGPIKVFALGAFGWIWEETVSVPN